MNHQPFLDEIFQSPRDDNPRLVYADWLTDHDDPRGEFIRIQCRRASVPFYKEEHWLLWQQEQALLAKHREEWAGDLADLVYHYQFHRGFPSRIRIFAEPFLQNANRIHAITPVEDVHFDFARDGQAEKLIGSDKLKPLNSILFGNVLPQFSRSGRGPIRLLMESQDVSKLRRLTFRSSITNDCLTRIQETKQFKNLESLSLSGDGGLRSKGTQWYRLFDGSHLPNLKCLRIDGGHAKPSSAFYSSSLWSQLDSLGMGFEKLNKQKLFEFLKSGPLRNLTSLEVYGAKPPFEHLFADNRMENLKSLSINSTKISKSDLDKIIKEELLPNLKALCADYHAFPAAGLDKIASSTIGQNLLALYDNTGFNQTYLKKMKSLKYLQLQARFINKKQEIDDIYGTSFAKNCNVDHWFGYAADWNSHFA